MNNRRRLAVLLFLFCWTRLLWAQEKFEIRYQAGEKFKITEKYDLAKHAGKQYLGYVSGEVRGVCEISAGGAASAGGLPVYAGTFYLLEEIRRGAKPVAKRIDETVSVSFSIKPNGEYVVDKNGPYPALRGFPAFPAEPVAVGETWRAYGARVVDPKRDGKFTRVKILAEYTYQGKGDLNGTPCDVIRARYAMRYKRGDDPAGDDRISGISGTHDVTIYFDAARSRPAFMRDRTEEDYAYSDGANESYKGFILTWFDMVVSLEKTKIVRNIKKELEDSGIKDVIVEERPEGVALTVNNIHFLPDQAIVRPDERGRLAELAAALTKIPKRTILVRGHTARWGSVETQVSLSVERAKAIVDYLAAQGIDAGRFIYEGKGATQPVADNGTEEGRMKNRRVEIIILED
ncbi:MAG: OmpA family protein [Spirochaetales bacterium]|nr:OmpA family protein [Spirochaetales bacterium]